jgi:hypothetical protein
LFGVFAIYLFVAAKRVTTADVDCGCGALGSSLTKVAWLRPATLLVVAVASEWAALVSQASVDTSFPERLTAVTSAWVIGTSLMCLIDLRAINAKSLHRAQDAYRLLILDSTRSSGSAAK